MQRNAVAAALIVAGSVLTLAACSHPPLPTPNSDRHTPTAMVEAVRAAAASDRSVIQIAPLRDPAIAGYVARARAAERDGDYALALTSIDAALKLSPGAPDILQYRAEVLILLHDYPAAVLDARKSYALGPKLGSLCVSNWQTVMEVADVQKNQVLVSEARDARDACHKSVPARY